VAVESLILTPPSNVGAGIQLNGSKWRVQSLNLGNPSRREELVTSTDSHGGMPARVSMRDAREVTATLRLMDAANMDAALQSIAALESYLELAERLASNGPTNPVEECVRLAYTPHESSQTYSLIVLTGEISEIPKDHQGWLIGYPTVTVRFVCDPFAYGARRIYLDTTTSAEIAPSISVPGGPGDVSPWTRMAIKDVAATGRGLLRIGVKNTAQNTTATSFDGTDDRVTTTYNPFTNGTTRTYMGWANRTTSATADTLFAGSVASPAVLALSAGSQDVTWKPQNSTTTTWSAAWPGNAQWVHWALVFNESTDAVTLYINGTLVSASTNAQAYNGTPGNLVIGARQSTTDPFVGAMAWFSIHDKALTAEEIAAAARRLSADQLTSFGNLGILLPLDAASGLTDLSGNGRNGTAAGFTAVGTTTGPLDESALSAVVSASAWTAINGSYSAGPPPLMSTSSTDYDNWSVLAQIPRQFRTGSFRVYAHRAYPTTGPGGAQVCLAWRGVGSSIRRGLPAVTVQSSSSDLFLGEVSTETAWDAWVETRGPVGITDLILVPTDSYLEATGPLAAVQMVGTTTALDALQSTSADIEARAMTTGGSWTTPGTPVWPVSTADWANRNVGSMVSPVFAQAGTGNHIEVQVQATIACTASVNNTPTNSSAPFIAQGIYARYVDSSNYLAFGYRGTSIVTDQADWHLIAVISGTAYSLASFTGSYAPSKSVSTSIVAIGLQLTADGRWQCSIAAPGSGVVKTGQGQAGVLSTGSILGNAGAAKAGLYDFTTNSSNTRHWKDFSIRNLVGVTPPPLPASQTVRLQGPKLTTTDNTEYPHIGSSGVTLRPGVNNNLTVMAQLSAGLHTTPENTPALDIDIDGYPRFLSVPHA
jgi:hypothetical protein